MNNHFFIFETSLTTRILFYICFTLALFIFFNSDIEAFPFPERQCFSKVENIDLVKASSIWGRVVYFSDQDRSNWPNDFVEFSSFVSVNGKTVTNEKPNENSGYSQDWIFKHLIEEFPHEPLACLLLAWCIYGFLGCLIGYMILRIYYRLLFP